MNFFAHRAKVAAVGATLIGILGAGGCSLNSQRSFPEVQATIEQRTGGRVEWLSGTAEEAGVEQRIHVLLSRDLSADDAVAIALVNNRSIQPMLEDLGVAEADLVQAGLLQNPVFSIAVEFPGRPHTRVDASLEMEFVDLLLLPLRKKTAAASFAATQARVTHEILHVAAEVRCAYYRAQADEQLLEAQRRAVAVSDASSEASGQLADAGNINPLDHHADQSVLVQAKLDFAAMQADGADDRAALAAILGLPDDAFHLSPGPPAIPSGDDPPLQDLENRALAQRFDLAAAKGQVEVAARTMGYANVDALLNGGGVGAAYTRDPDVKGTLGPSLSVPLPIFDQGQPAVARAQAEWRQARDRYDALVMQIRSDVRRTRTRMVLERKRVEAYQQTLLPLRRTIVRETLLQYNAMQTSVFGLLQARQAEIDAARGQITALRDYWLARVKLEEAIAGRLPAASTVPATRPGTMNH